MYSINGTYIYSKKNIYEHMTDIDGIPIIDKDAIAEESDRRGTSQRGEGINYSEETGGITRTTEVDKEVNITNESQSYSELIDIIDKETQTEASEEIKTERKATLEESLTQSKTTKILPSYDKDGVRACKYCSLEDCPLTSAVGDYPDLSEYFASPNNPYDSINSISIPEGFTATLYKGKNFEGESWTIDGPQMIGCFRHLEWDDEAKSLKVVKTDGIAKFALHCSFGGWNKEYGPGEYPSVNALGMTGGISSIKLGSDIKIVVYSGENFSGDKKEYDGPTTVNCLVSHGWNDRINSIQIISKSASRIVNVSESEWTKYLEESPNKIIKRECQDCASSHKTIYYKRLTPLNKLTANSGIKDLMLDNWFSQGNILNTDFELYSSYKDAVNKKKTCDDSDYLSSINMNSFAGTYDVWYNGEKRTTDMNLNCDGSLSQPGIFTDRLHSENVKNKCSTDWDSDKTLFIEKTHGANKYECVKIDGNNLIGSHYTGFEAYWGNIEYRRQAADQKIGIIEFPATTTSQFVHAIYIKSSTITKIESSGVIYNFIKNAQIYDDGSKPPLNVWKDRTYTFNTIPSGQSLPFSWYLQGPHKSIGAGTKIKLHLYNAQVGDEIYVAFESSGALRNGGWDKSLKDIGFNLLHKAAPRWTLESFESHKYNLQEKDLMPIQKPKNNWKFCNYDDPGVGFPRDCDLSQFKGWQWNSTKRNNGRSKFRYSIEIGDNQWLTLYQSGNFTVPPGDTNLSTTNPEPENSSLEDNENKSIYLFYDPKEYSFDGSKNMIASESPRLKITDEFTVMGWVFQSSRSTDWVRFFGKGMWTNRNYGIWVHPDGTLLNQIYGPSYKTHRNHNGVWPGPKLELSKWTHLVCTFKKDDRIRMYVNGELAGENLLDGFPLIDNEPFTVGGADFHAYLKGAVKHVAVFNEVIGSDKINELAKDHTKELTTILKEDGTLETTQSTGNNKITDISALPLPGETLWHYVKNRKPNENKYLWSGRIYNCIRGDKGCGNSFVDEGGSRHNAAWFLGDKGTLPPGCTVLTENEYKYKQIGSDISELDHVLIEINATNDAHIALGEDTEHNGKHYEIVLGGWSNNKSVIRSQNQGGSLVQHTEKIFGQDLVNGLLYKYYVVTQSNGTFESQPYKTEVLNLSAQRSDFWWASGNVLNSGRSDYIGLNISGYITVPKSGNYKFKVQTDDGFRMKISDNYVINSWFPQAPTWRESGNVTLEQGTYKLEIDWYEWGGYATMPMYWLVPGEDWTTIPSTALSLFGQKPQKFWISWKDNMLKVGREHTLDEKLLLELNVNEYNYNIKNILVSTGWGSSGAWKIYSGTCDTNILTKETADKLCNNPCYWYGKEGRGNSRQAFIDSNMCDCSKGNDPFGCHERDGKCAKAINWDIEPTIIPAFTQSNSSSLASSKEYQETIQEEEKNETNVIRSSEMTFETEILDPNISIIPGKTKDVNNAPSYFTQDELDKEEEKAGEKLRLSGGPTSINNIVKTISINEIETPDDTENDKQQPKSESIPLPPPPPPVTPVTRNSRQRQRGRTEESELAEEGEGSGVSMKIIIIILILILMYIIMRSR
tara:strand:+ start:584 stop:5302 length:4719 start_codon:yes stop_codon:yes gene_type:complete